MKTNLVVEQCLLMHILYENDQSVQLLEYVLIRTNTVIRFIRLDRFCSDTCLQMHMILLQSVDQNCKKTMLMRSIFGQSGDTCSSVRIEKKNIQIFLESKTTVRVGRK